MSKADSAVLPDVVVDEATETRSPGYKMYVILMYNDQDHTFEYVIETLVKVFGYDQEKAVQTAIEIHKSDKAVVWSGMLEHAELKVEQIRNRPPDCYGPRRVEYPLKCEIRPI